MSKTYTIWFRRRILVNTDPQRRCYNGCNFSEELRWTDWATIESTIAEERLPRRLEFWRELNDYAISERGESARAEYKAVENE